MCCASRGERVAQHPSGQGANAVGGFVSTPCLDVTERREEFLRGDRAHRAVTDIGVEKPPKTSAENGHGLGREGSALKCEPFRGHRFERFGLRTPLGLAPGRRVDAVGFSRARLSATSGYAPKARSFSRPYMR
jgi:hypothetical protein